MNASRVAYGVAIATYAAATFISLWMTAHAYARESNPDGSTGVLVFQVLVLFVLPLLTGFAIGRWWAVLLVLWVVLAGRVADGLEPLQRDPSGELEGSLELATLFVVCVHVVLLLAGVGLRKLIRRRRPPGNRWTLM